MTKVKLIIILIAIFEIAIFFAGYMYMQQKTKNINESYLARREELITKQNNLNSLILDLNRTLQQEITNNNALSSELASKSGQPSTGGSGSTGTSNPPPVNNPPPVTRAS